MDSGYFVQAFNSIFFLILIFNFWLIILIMGFFQVIEYTILGITVHNTEFTISLGFQ